MAKHPHTVESDGTPGLTDEQIAELTDGVRRGVDSLGGLDDSDGDDCQQETIARLLQRYRRRLREVDVAPGALWRYGYRSGYNEGITGIRRRRRERTIPYDEAVHSGRGAAKQRKDDGMLSLEDRELVDGARLVLARAVAALTAREQHVLEAQLADRAPDFADSVSRENLRQICSRMRRKLKNYFDEHWHGSERDLLTLLKSLLGDPETMQQILAEVRASRKSPKAR